MSSTFQWRASRARARGTSTVEFLIVFLLLTLGTAFAVKSIGGPAASSIQNRGAVLSLPFP